MEITEVLCQHGPQRELGGANLVQRIHCSSSVSFRRRSFVLFISFPDLRGTTYLIDLCRGRSHSNKLISFSFFLFIDDAVEWRLSGDYKSLVPTWPPE